MRTHNFRFQVSHKTQTKTEGIRIGRSPRPKVSIEREQPERKEPPLPPPGAVPEPAARRRALQSQRSEAQEFQETIQARNKAARAQRAQASLLESLSEGHHVGSEAIIDAYRRAEHLGAALHEVDAWAADGGRTLDALRQLSASLEHNPVRSQLGENARARAEELLSALERWRARAPSPKAQPVAPVQAPLSIDAAQLKGNMRDQLKGLFEELERARKESSGGESSGGSLSPIFTVDPALSKGPSGRAATLEELTDVAARAAEDPRLHNDHLSSGCHSRAHIVAHQLQRSGLNAAKVFVKPDQRSIFMTAHQLKPRDAQGAQIEVDGQPMNWFEHVAAASWVEGPGEGLLMIVDPSMSKEPMTLDAWSRRFVHDQNYLIEFELASPVRYEPGMKADQEDLARGLATAWEHLGNIEARKE